MIVADGAYSARLKQCVLRVGIYSSATPVPVLVPLGPVIGDCSTGPVVRGCNLGRSQPTRACGPEASFEF